LLRPGTDAGSDALLVELLDRWKTLQTRLEVAVGLREFCAISALDPQMRDKIQNIAPDTETDKLDASGLLMGVLWPRSNELRRMSLNSYNPYRNERGLTDPRLISELLLRDVNADINLDAPNWLGKAHEMLVAHGCCRLCVRLEDSPKLALATAQSLAVPVDVGHLQFYPLVERYEENSEVMAVVLGLWEDATSMTEVLTD